MMILIWDNYGNDGDYDDDDDDDEDVDIFLYIQFAMHFVVYDDCGGSDNRLFSVFIQACLTIVDYFLCDRLSEIGIQYSYISSSDGNYCAVEGDVGTWEEY